MSWINQLYETYQQCATKPEFINSDKPLLPICHTYQNAHIEVVISNTGDFLRAKALSKGDLSTIIPCTEASGGRSGSKPVNHPLSDKLQYLAGDFLIFGGIVTTGFKKNPEEPHQNYLSQLLTWIESPYTHPKIEAISTYAKKGQLIADLIEAKILSVDDDNKLIKAWDYKEYKDSIFIKKLYYSNYNNQWNELKETPESDEKKSQKEKAFDDLKPKIFTNIPTGQSPQGAFVRWRVETQGDPQSATWEDRSLMEAWINYYTTRGASKGLCMVSGKEAILAEQHPSGLRHGADKAKLISSNDKTGYTFRGRFTDKEGNQACTISSEITQKAHNTIRWLIQRKQAYHYGDQVFVAWAKAGTDIPDPFSNTNQLFGMDVDSVNSTQSMGDIGQAFAHKLSKQIAGYHSKLGLTEQIIIMGLDSATPGRMAITYYRELTGSDFLERIKNWHECVSWEQNYSLDVKFIGVPSPRDIAEAAYGQRIDDKLRKATVERLLPCIIDGEAIPQDLITSSYHRLCNRVGMDAWEWEKTLGITCALVRGSKKERSYKMALEIDRTSRDYLYGRLLAIADYLEYCALDKNNKHPTSAARLMHQFSMHPYKTWRNIELSLTSYKPRIHVGLLIKLENLIDDVMDKFSSEDFIKSSPLSSEFLLAFHSQRKELWKKSENKDTTKNITEEIGV